MVDIKTFRRVNNLKQIELADYLGIGISFISQIENGKVNLPIEKFNKLIENDKGWDTAPLLETKQDETISPELPFGKDTPMPEVENMDARELIKTISIQAESIKNLISLSQEDSKRIDKLIDMLAQNNNK